MTVGILGAGAWGTAIAKSLAENGHEVTIWCHEAETAQDINARHANSRFLPEVALPASLRAVTDPESAAAGKDFIFLAVPSPFLLRVVRSVITVPDILDGKSVIAILTKGFIQTGRGPRLIIETLEDYLPGFYRGNLVYVSGPSHAEEVARRRVTGLVAASANGRNAIKVRDMLSSRELLVFASFDPVGVQVCAASKNVVAIAFGMLDALMSKSEEFGDNTESLLLAAGLNEIQILGRALGATHPETFTSISGVGDLDVTCRSKYGRNRRFGRDIVEKGALERFSGLADLLSRLDELEYLPEGAVACSFIKAVIDEKKLAMPICNGVFRILNKEIAPADFIHEFLGAYARA
jgi:glycerol-3-phosphate dehydrogenase (NAD(P)+)